MDFVQRRNGLYRGAVLATGVFALVAFGLIGCFKHYEDYFDSHGRIAVVAEAALVEQNNASLSAIRKRNFRVNIVDEPTAKLVVPFQTQTQMSNIVVCEEFTQNKLVVTLKEGTSYIEEGAVLTSDSTWMEAVGVYRRDEDIVIEVYCHDVCGYEMLYENSMLTISFLPLREQYDKFIVVYTPWSNRNNIHRNEWNQAIQKIQEEHSVKVFSSIAMQEEYAAEEIMEFANRIHADMVIGMELVNSNDPRVVTVCNPQYFIPYFGNVELAALLEHEFTQITSLPGMGVKALEEEQRWLALSGVPTALTRFYVSLEQKNVEQNYNLNQRMIEALSNIIGQVTERQNEDENR